MKTARGGAVFVSEHSLVLDSSDAPLRDIATRRLRLPAMRESFLEACLRSDKREAEAGIGLRVSRNWLNEADLIGMRLEEFRADPAYAVVHGLGGGCGEGIVADSLVGVDVDGRNSVAVTHLDYSCY